MAGSHHAVDTSEVEKHQLMGKHNYIEWRRNFDRAAKSHDLWSLLTTEAILYEPKEEDFISYKPMPYKPPSTRAKAKEGEAMDEDPVPEIDVNKSLFLWQAAYRKWERQKDRVRMVKTLIVKSVVSSIAHEIEDMKTPNLQVKHLKDTYGVSDEFTRATILEKITALKLYQCESMSDYINQHRDFKTDLVRAGLPYNDSQMATNLIHGLPKSYGDFVKMWTFHRSQSVGSEPDIHFLQDRLLAEEASQIQDKPKHKTHASAKTNKVCTHKDCGKPGHDEKDCWIAHPEKMPQRIKDKQKSHNSSDKSANDSDKKLPKPKGIVAMIQSSTNPFHCLSDNDFNDSTSTPSTNHPTSTDRSIQNEIQEDKVVRFQGESEDMEDDLDFAGCRLPNVVCVAQQSCNNQRDVILLDSGADICIFNHKKWFSSLTPTFQTVSSAEDGHSLQLEGGGSVNLSLQTSSENPMSLTITQAAYAPTAKFNIISLSYLAEKAQLSGWWNDNKITIMKDDMEVGFADLVDGLYHLQVTETPNTTQSTHFVGTINYDHPVWVWHRRLGHLGLQNMINLLNISTGIPLTKQQIRGQMAEICPVCAVSRALNRTPRDPASRRQDSPGGLIHCDVWGPYPIPGLGGVKYIFFATDDATRFTWERAFNNKSDLPDIFKHNHHEIEKGLGITIRGYRFDGEFYLGPIGTWLTSKHIPYEPTVPYAHYMGGAHERVNRIIREKAAPMIQELSISGQISKIITEQSLQKIKESKIPENLWHEAITYSVFLKNRSPTRALKNSKTPWEALFGRKPHFQRESIWGSRVYVTLPPEKARLGKPKLHHPRGYVGYFVGCDGEAIFRIYSPEQLRVFRVGMARVQQGLGLDDPQNGQSYSDRLPNNDNNEEVIQNGIDTIPDSDPDDDAVDHNADPLTPIEENDVIIDSDAGSDHSISDTNARENNTNILEEDALFSSRIEEPQNTEDIDTLAEDLWFQSPNDDDFFGCHSDNDNSFHDEDNGAILTEQDDNTCDHQHHETTSEEQEKTPSSNQPILPRPLSPVCCDKAGTETVSRFFAGMVSANSPQEDLDNPSDDQAEPERINSNNRLIRNGWVTDEPCYECYIRGMKCVWESEDVHKCDYCAANRSRCSKPTDYNHPDLLAKIEQRKQSKKERYLKASLAKNPDIIRAPQGVKKEDKCFTCHWKQAACDGNSPCDRCIQTGQKCRPQDYKETEKCNQCKSQTAFCDRGKPCSTCIKLGKDCLYTKESGLMVEMYPVTEESKNKLTILSEDECANCHRMRTTKKLKRVCDKSKPCAHCVQRSKYDRAACVFRVDDHFERHVPGAYEFDSRRNVVLKDDWESFTYMAKVHVRTTKANRTKALKKSAKHPPLIHTNMNNQEGSQNPATEDEQVEYFIMPTASGADLECGLHALVNSISAQIRDQQTPTVDELRQILRGREMAERALPTNTLNTSNLLVDQVAGVLQLWGTSVGLNLQLGVILEEGDPLTEVIFPTEGHTTIWIHNDNAINLTGATLNHYSGVDFTSYCVFKQDETQIQGQNIVNQLTYDDLDADIAAFQGKSVNAISSSSIGCTPEPGSYAEATRSSEAKHWEQAMENEKNSLTENDTFQIVNDDAMPHDYEPLLSKWVFKRKLDRDGQVKTYKARLVAKGYLQKEGIDYEETFSSVIKSTSFRTLFGLAALKGWKIWMMDVVTAFLNGDLKEEIYMKPPPGWKLSKGKIFRLNKTLYGLKQAPREWYNKFWSTIESWGFRRSSYDNCVFTHDDWQVILGVWVDDSLILAPNEDAANKLKANLAKAFKMKDEGLCNYYLGMQVLQDEDGILVYHKSYITQMLQRFDMLHTKSRKVPMNPGTSLTMTDKPNEDEDFITNYQQKVGSIVYLAGQIRPDIAFAAHYAARFMSKPSQSHLDEVESIMSYAKHTLNKGYRYKKGDGKMNLAGFVDSDFAGCVDTRKSTTGWIFMLAGAPISWASQRQRTVSLSTTDAEYVAAAEASKEAIWIRGFINDLNIEGMKIDAVPLYIDNEGARKLTRNPEFHNRTKYIDIRYHFIRERVMETKEIDTQRVDTKFNIADILTKPLAKQRFEELTKMMGMVDVPEEQEDDENDTQD